MSSGPVQVDIIELGCLADHWGWKQNFLLQLMLPFLITVFCLFKFLGSKVVWNLRQQSGQPSVLYKLLALLFNEPKSEQELKVSVGMIVSYLV